MSAASASGDPTAAAKQPCKRRKYANWFASPFIHDILLAFKLTSRSAKKTVMLLQRNHPDRFDELSESTLRGWFDSNGVLLPRFKLLLAEQKSAPRGRPHPRVLSAFSESEDRVKGTLQTMRTAGTSVSIAVIRHVMRAILPDAALSQLKLSHGFISHWAREQMNWSWRMRTTAASKLPADWRQQGVLMAKWIAFSMQMFKVHPSLVVNMDQTGVHLVPASSRTFESKGAHTVQMIGADDKRQITACIASSLDGDLLPLQLIFQGKTSACHPPMTELTKEAHVCVTHSENHWSNQETMRQWVAEVLLPYSNHRIAQHNLPRDSHIVLVLDVWAVHKSEEFRTFLRIHHVNIHLVFVPPNSTSQLQVADVMLQRTFKHGLRKRFNDWSAGIIKEQIEQGQLIGLSPLLKMSLIKPLILQWCIESWLAMREVKGRDFIKTGWHTCCTSFFNVLDKDERAKVLEEVLNGQLDAKAFVPADNENSDADEKSDSDEDSDQEDELDVMKKRQYGTRKSTRKRNQTALCGFMLNSSQIALSEDSEA